MFPTPLLHTEALRGHVWSKDFFHVWNRVNFACPLISGSNKFFPRGKYFVLFSLWIFFSCEKRFCLSWIFFFLVKTVFFSREKCFFFSWIFFSCKKNIFFLVKNVFVERIFLNKKFLLISKWYIYILYKFLGVEKTWKNAEKTEKQNVKKNEILKKFTSSNWVKLVCKFLCRTKWNIFLLQEKMYDFCVDQKCREKPNVKKKFVKKNSRKK